MEEATSSFIKNDSEKKEESFENKEAKGDDTTISKILDSSGLFQIRSLAMVCPVNMFLGIVVLSPVFLNYTPSFVCRPAKNFTEKLHSFEEFEEFFHNISTLDKCSRLKLPDNASLENYLAQLSQPNNYSVEDCTDGWWFASDAEKTVVTEFNLICENAWKRPMTVSLLMAGMLVGSMMGGPISDRFGRKLTVTTAYVAHFLLEIGLSFSGSYLLHSIQIFILGYFHIMCYIGTYVWAQEIAHNGSKRNLAALGVNLLFALGGTLTSLVAYFAYDWKWIYRIFAIISIAYFPILCLAPHSPQWLIQSGNKKQALKMLKTIIKENKLELNKECLTELNLNGNNNEKSSKTAQTLSSPMILLRNSILRKRIFLICFMWNVAYLGYYTMALNSSNLGGNIYINSLVGNSIDVVSAICMAVLLKKIGRRNALAFLSATSGGFCLFSPILNNANNVAGITCAMVGRFFVTMAMTLTILFTGELFPTLIRNTSVGIASMSARICSILSPFLIFVGEEVDLSIPFYVMAAVFFLAVILIFLLPETSKTLLPDTLDDVIDQEKYFCFQACFGKAKNEENMESNEVGEADT